MHLIKMLGSRLLFYVYFTGAPQSNSEHEYDRPTTTKNCSNSTPIITLNYPEDWLDKYLASVFWLFTKQSRFTSNSVWGYCYFYQHSCYVSSQGSFIQCPTYNRAQQHILLSNIFNTLRGIPVPSLTSVTWAHLKPFKKATIITLFFLHTQLWLTERIKTAVAKFRDKSNLQKKPQTDEKNICPCSIPHTPKVTNSLFNFFFYPLIILSSFGMKKKYYFNMTFPFGANILKC